MTNEMTNADIPEPCPYGRDDCSGPDNLTAMQCFRCAKADRDGYAPHSADDPHAGEIHD